MENSELKYIKNLIESALMNDNNSLEMSIISLVRLLNKNGFKDNKYTKEIRQLLQEHQAGLIRKNDNIRNYNKIFEEDTTNKLYRYISANIMLKSLYLNRKVLTKIEDIIMSYRLKDKLKENNLDYIKKVILSGKPGTGKTSIAIAIAYELELDCLHINISSLFSKYLGDTPKKIKRLFDEIKDKEAIIIFDEFDSIGIDRSNNNETGEMRRVVNSVLTSLDSWEGKGIIIATTNDNTALDKAVWRRFDEKINVDLPSDSINEKLWMNYTNVNFNKEELSILSAISRNYTPAEIKIISQQARRKKVLMDEDIFLNIIKEVSPIEKNEKIIITNYLYDDKYQLSIREIANVLESSKSTIQRYLKEEAKL